MSACLTVQRKLGEEFQPQRLAGAITNHSFDLRGGGGWKLKLHQIAGINRDKSVQRHSRPAYSAATSRNRSDSNPVKRDDANGQIDLLARPSSCALGVMHFSGMLLHLSPLSLLRETRLFTFRFGQG